MFNYKYLDIQVSSGYLTFIWQQEPWLANLISSLLVLLYSILKRISFLFEIEEPIQQMINWKNVCENGSHQKFMTVYNPAPRYQKSKLIPITSQTNLKFN